MWTINIGRVGQRGRTVTLLLFRDFYQKEKNEVGPWRYNTLLPTRRPVEFCSSCDVTAPVPVNDPRISWTASVHVQHAVLLIRVSRV